MEFLGHGDPLAAATMKTEAHKAEEPDIGKKQPEKFDHFHGDPLLKATMKKRSRKEVSQLYSEAAPHHSDPLLLHEQKQHIAAYVFSSMGINVGEFVDDGEADEEEKYGIDYSLIPIG